MKITAYVFTFAVESDILIIERSKGGFENVR